jgi:hypothetical protein
VHPLDHWSGAKRAAVGRGGATPRLGLRIVLGVRMEIARLSQYRRIAAASAAVAPFLLVPAERPGPGFLPYDGDRTTCRSPAVWSPAGLFPATAVIPLDQGKVRGEVIFNINFDYGNGVSAFVLADIRGGSDLFAAGGRAGASNGNLEASINSALCQGSAGFRPSGIGLKVA